MTTFKQALIEDLTSSGFFPDQATEVFNLFVEQPAQVSMKGRWNEDVTGYPAMILNISLVAIRATALDYIKEKMPKAWFRPVFDKEMAKELGI